jgi:hypothetical protein
LEFKRSTINAAQKAGRQLTKTATTRPTSNDDSDSESDGEGSGPDSNAESDGEGSGLDSNAEETELANTVSAVANAPAISSSLLARAGPVQLENTKAKHHGFYESARAKQCKSRGNVGKFIEG